MYGKFSKAELAYFSYHLQSLKFTIFLSKLSTKYSEFCFPCTFAVESFQRLFAVKAKIKDQ